VNRGCREFIDIIDYKLNLQEHIDINSIIDKSPYTLFTYVNEKKFELLPYEHFFKVCPLFSKRLGIKEKHTKYKKNTIDKFINIICNTKVFIFLFHILREKKIIKYFCDFPIYIYKLWFTPHSKKNKIYSSLFEHIFIGETTYYNIHGFHNWIQLYNEEKIGKLNYYGYIKYISNIIFIKFSWESLVKKNSSFFIGTSIEFEMALYTLLYVYTNIDHKYITIKYQNNDVKFNIIKKKNKLITVYPIL
jgi:poly(U)-specific endoribonuclease